MAFLPGDSVLARRSAQTGSGRGEGWGEVDLLDGWHEAEVVKVRNAGKAEGPLYNLR